MFNLHSVRKKSIPTEWQDVVTDEAVTAAAAALPSAGREVVVLVLDTPAVVIEHSVDKGVAAI